MIAKGEAAIDQHLVSIRGVSKSYDGVKALKRVDFDLLRGEIHGLVGHNGAGKSTLINIISGITLPDSGDILLQGNLVHNNSPAFSRSLGLYVVYQAPFIQPHLTVAENLFINRWPKGFLCTVNWKEIERQAKAILSRFEVKLDSGRLAGELNLAQQKMLEVTLAISSDAKILIFDEPTASLTINEVNLLFDFFKSLRNHGVGIIYISHHLQEIFELCDRVTVVRNGERVATQRVSDLNLDALTELMMGGAVLRLDKKHTVWAGELLSVADLNTALLKSVSFRLKKGEILGLAGLNGSGRSELLRALCGLDPAQIGDMRIDGISQQIKNYKQSVAAGVAYLPENRSKEGLIPQRSIRENLSLSSLHDIRGFFGVIDSKQERKLALDAVDLLHIKLRSVDDPVTSLSGGNQQKVVLGKLLATHARILLLDEPTSGIDIGAKAQIFQSMDEYASSTGSILFVSPELHELLLICDRILILKEGRIVNEVQNPEIVSEESLFYMISE